MATRIADRPALRGVSHIAATFAAVVGALCLYLLAESAGEYISAAIYSSALLLLFGLSATYHSFPWSPRPRQVLRRLDHSMIFLLIAGSYTPFCLLALGTAWSLALLSVVWLLAGAGVALKLAWVDSPRWLSVLLYVALGWLAVVAAPVLAATLPLSTILVLLAGGMLYTVGGLVYALRRPDPAPSVFGYHEVFHLFVIAGAATHYGLVVALFVDGV
jgi:hemolysin III